MTAPSHVFPSLFSIQDNDLEIGGMPLTQLAERIGRTPFYAYDRSLITERVAQLRAALPREIQILFAIKANPMRELLQIMAGLVDGFDVASSDELQRALDTRINPAHISFAGPGKTDAELTHAIEAGIVLNIESPLELERVARIGAERDQRPQVAVRVNPGFELKSSGMKMGGGPKPFGVDAEQVPALLRRIGELGVAFLGFHIFCGSQNLRADAIMEAQSKTFELAFALAGEAPSPVRLLNIGGGFGIPYFPGDAPLDIAPIGKHLGAWMPKVKNALPHAQVVIELGRYLVGEAGVYVCRVIDRKISRGQIFLITDGGMHHHLAASGNLGQVIRKNYPVAVGNRMKGGEKEIVSVMGPLCTPLDILADKIELPKTEVGDLIVVFQSGAYGLTASPTAFLGHPAPAEVLI